METDIKLSPDKLCRACLCKSTNMRSLTTKIEGDHRTFLEVLVFVANLDIHTSEKLPKHICNECEVLMLKADAFKQRCVESENILSVYSVKDLQNESSLENDGKPLIKRESTKNKVKVSKKKIVKRSDSMPKSSKSDLFDLFTTSANKDEKELMSNENLIDSAFENSLDTPLDMKQNSDNIQIVKIESIGDDNDMSIDFGDTEALETIPIEFKQEDLTVREVRVHSCSCGTIFNNEHEYKTHLETCDGYTKSTKIKLERKNPNGGRNITIKSQIICPECDLDFKTVKAFKSHRQIHKNIDDETGIFECNKCMRKFSRQSSYTAHMKRHDLKANIKYICETCKREFQHKAHLDNHILAVHTREKGYVCELCMINFSTEESLDAHKETHKEEKKHQCSLCKKAFYMLSTLNDHMRTHTGEKPFLCPICGRGFSQNTNMAQHMRRHQGLKPFKCEDCDRRFVSKGELVAHNRKHSGAHPFVCDECGSSFTTSSSLVKHRRIHTGERPYACDLCPMRFAASGTLKNHRRTHTGEKPFQCSYCEKAFVQRHDLISHIRCHTGERPFTCGCGQAFRKAAALRQHARAHAGPRVDQPGVLPPHIPQYGDPRLRNPATPP